MDQISEPLAAFTRDAKTLIGRARLAGFDVRGLRKGDSVAIAGRRKARRGVVEFRVTWPHGGSPEGMILYAGWWWFPMGIRAIIGELTAGLSVTGSLDEEL